MEPEVFGGGVLGRGFLHELRGGKKHGAIVRGGVRGRNFTGNGELRGGARLVTDVSGIAHPTQRRYRRGRRLGLVGFPFVADFCAWRGKRPSHGKPRQPFLPDLLLIGSECVETDDFFREALGRNGELDWLPFWSERLLERLFLLRSVFRYRPAGIGAKKLASGTNRQPDARLLHIQDLYAQQRSCVAPRGRGCKGDDKGAFGLDVFVAAEADEIRERLARLQPGEETDAFVARRRDGSGKKEHATYEDKFTFHRIVDDITAHNEDSAKNPSREAGDFRRRSK